MGASFARLGSLAEGASFDLSKLGLDIGDIHAVLTVDERTHLLDSALVSFEMKAEGISVKLDLRYQPVRREQAGHAAFAVRLATTLGA